MQWLSVQLRAFLFTSCWNWKCALMSATVRASIYLFAMVHGRTEDRVSAVLVELVYVTLTAGFYSGWQQKALQLHSRVLGDLTIVLLVPACAQFVEWMVHHAVHPSGGRHVTLAICAFALISALFHRHVMRHGVFLTGAGGLSFAGDMRRIPRLLLSFLATPVRLVPSGWFGKPPVAREPENSPEKQLPELASEFV